MFTLLLFSKEDILNKERGTKYTSSRKEWSFCCSKLWCCECGFFFEKKWEIKHVRQCGNFFKTKWKTKHCECGFFFKQNERQKIVSVDISSNKNERQKLRMWRKKMEDQHTASVDSSLNKIKDKTSWVWIFLQRKSKTKHYEWIFLQTKMEHKKHCEKTLWVLIFLQMKQNKSFFILRVVFSSNNDIRQKQCVWFFFKQKWSCFHCLERAGEDDNRDPRKEGYRDSFLSRCAASCTSTDHDSSPHIVLWFFHELLFV